MIGLTLVGAALRLWGLGGLGLTHFDEGVYALAGLWPMLPGGLAGIDPMVIPYAPGGYPFLVGLAYTVFGVADTSAIVVAIGCGVLTIPAAAWVGRRTFGPGAGAAAGALAALSLAHVAFSRKALTDAPFLFCWVLAMGLGGRFLERPGLLRALALGLAVGLAQYFKYNGWLAGAVVIAAAGLGIGFRAEERRAGRVAATFGFGLLAAIVAALVYAPWFQFVERHGGYAALLRHHQSYLGGPGAWFRFWSQQLAQVGALSGGPAWGAVTWTLAWLGSALLGWKQHSNATDPRPARTGLRLWAGLAAGAVALGALPGLPWWLGLAWSPWLVRDERPAVRMLAAWWVVLSIVTPLYHPYARLWLPLHAAGWLLVAGLVREASCGASGFGEARAEPEARAARGRTRAVRLRQAILLLVLGAAVAQQAYRLPRPFELARMFQPTAELRKLVSELPTVLPAAGAVAPLQVLARRPLAYYLVLQGRYPFQLEASYRELLEHGRPGAWAMVDEAVLGPEERKIGDRLRVPPTPPDRLYREQLDPITSLDVDPNTAYRAARDRTVPIWILAPRPSGVAGASTMAPQRRGPSD